MLRIGEKEIEAVAKALRSGKLFRYGPGDQCARFEKRYGAYLGIEHACMTSSGTTALTAAMAGLGLGPGDEVIVPSHTYMATAVAVLAVGAIPVVVDVDESLTLSPEALESAIGPRTRAVIPVHLWGLPCDMDWIMPIARRHELRVIEDACQSVGGGYHGRMLGTFGDASGFSFNYFKNMSCGEGGCVVTHDDAAFQRMRCTVDCCNMYWMGRDQDFVPFISAGSRASEVEGAIMNAQLDRLPGMIRTLRRQKKKILAQTRGVLTAAPCHSLDDECATHTAFTFASERQAKGFVAALGEGVIAGQTGRHVYTEWDPIFAHRGSHHPALNPFEHPKNKGCRMDYSRDMCAASLAILNRTVMVLNDPDRKAADVDKLIGRIREAAEKTGQEEREAQGVRV